MARERERTDFGRRLYEARTAAKLSQPALAAKVGMAQSTLAEAESARHGSSFTAQLAAAMGVRAEWLASGAGPKFPATTSVQEPQSIWPFPKIALARVLALDEDDRGYVQRRLLQAVEECEAHAASPRTISPAEAEAIFNRVSVGPKPAKRRPAGRKSA